jgi:esterase/lipase
MKRVFSLLASIIAGLCAFVGVYHLFRIRLPRTVRAPQPTTTYDEACARLEAVKAQDDPRVNARCPTIFLEHGRQTEQVTVLLHGFTNCPYQFLDLGRQLHAVGHTVLIPRFPHHGLDPMADDHGELSVEALITLADEAVDIACGLGKKITVCGLSLGGALSTWVAQNRIEADRVIALSPALSIYLVPGGWERPLSNLLNILPNFFVWWDPSLRKPLPGREHQYPRFASRGMATILQLGQIVAYEARQAKPAARSILVVNNPADQVVDQAFTAEVVEAWKAHQGMVETHDLPGDLRLPHDYIDPTQPDQQVDNVYPLLLKFLVKEP